MSTPAFLHIGLVSCIATNDTTGSDSLVGQLGDLRFAIGEFSDGSEIDVGLEVPVPVGVTEFAIYESDMLFDDPLATIDLTHDMDVERIVGILNDDARYDVRFRVASSTD